MKKLTVSLVFLFALVLMGSQPVGHLFPSMPVKKLDGTSLDLPKAVKGKFTILAMAYSKKAEDDLKTWNNPLYQKFIAEPPKNSLFGFDPYDVHLFFVPMFTGVSQAAAGNASKKLKEGLDPKFHEHFLIFEGKLKDYKDQLGFSQKDEPYFFVLDKTGKVIFKTQGAYSQAKMNQIEDKIEPAD